MSNSTHRGLTIGLLWHSLSSDNLGVGALSQSQIAICESVAERLDISLTFIVFGTGGGKNYTPNGTNIEFGSRVSIKQMLAGRSGYLADLDRCHLVLDIGEGDSFTDIYGLRRYIFQLISKLAVLAKGKPLVLSPQTIGPFNHWFTGRLATFVMRRCVTVFSRDAVSAAYLQTLGVIANADQAVDIAFRLPYKKVERLSERCRIGINVSGLLYSGGYSGGNQFNLTVDYPRLIRALICEWCADPFNEVWLIPHVLTDSIPNDDDRGAILHLAKEFPLVRRAPDFESPAEAKSFIATLDFLTGARMHACIAAFSSGVPVVPFAYSRKFNGLFASLGYPWLADGKVLTTAQALDVILSGFRDRKSLSTGITAAMAVVEELLGRYDNFLAHELARLVNDNAAEELYEY